ncbi:DgyrCDS2258 [Dimorphilus gyrociliatus]|uniref:DgyrCDS2258 n=1 Tax=Dimorphilus gyrociliatus TaxID=2664684 RepID=A0A7I8VBP8_9ANNE|nr:DgyrCDS2258 [Dimorphilus gyrociliatus]
MARGRSSSFSYAHHYYSPGTGFADSLIDSSPVVRRKFVIDDDDDGDIAPGYFPVSRRAARITHAGVDDMETEHISSRRQDQRLLNDITNKMYKIELEGIRPGYNAWTQSGRRFPKFLKKQKISNRGNENATMERPIIPKRKIKRVETEEIAPPTLEERLLMLKARANLLPRSYVTELNYVEQPFQRPISSYVPYTPIDRRVNENRSKVSGYEDLLDDSSGRRLRGGGGEIFNR